jgi:hypothetical protein
MFPARRAGVVIHGTHQDLVQKPGANASTAELGQVLSSVNDEISRDNPTAMFVTAIIRRDR